MCAIFGAEFWRLFRRQKKPMLSSRKLGSVGNESSRDEVAVEVSAS